MCATSLLAPITMALTGLPTLVMFQRITPDHVEATMMAIAMSILNISNGLVGDIIGAFVNDTWVGVTAEDLSKYYILNYITLGAVFYEILLIRLIPLRKEVEEQMKEDKAERERRN
jgi:hypothetical protein